MTPMIAYTLAKAVMYNIYEARSCVNAAQASSHFVDSPAVDTEA